MPERYIPEPTLKPPVDAAGDGQVIPESRARQGRRGYSMLAVLGASTLLALVLMFGVWSIFFGRLAAHPDDGGQTGVKTAAVRSFTQPLKAPRAAPEAAARR